MRRLLNIAAAVVLLAVPVAVATAQSADARQKKPGQSPRPQVIIKDRWLYGPPPPPSSDRNYYGPAPSIQPPMQRVPLPAPLAQPPIR
jgi:hypothetical protein